MGIEGTDREIEDRERAYRRGQSREGIYTRGVKVTAPTMHRVSTRPIEGHFSLYSRFFFCVCARVCVRARIHTQLGLKILSFSRCRSPTRRHRTTSLCRAAPRLFPVLACILAHAYVYTLLTICRFFRL